MGFAHDGNHSNLLQCELSSRVVLLRCDDDELTPEAVLTGLALSLGMRIDLSSSGTLAMISTSLGDCLSLLRLHTLARTALRETETRSS